MSRFSARTAHTTLAGLLLAMSAGLVQAQSLRTVSVAESAQGYRTDAARHIYTVYADRIFKGALPPLVHAIVVTETEVDADGNVQDIRVVRAPSHAPEVTAAVTAMIRSASPLPTPSHLGGTRFTEVWLVDESGRFQLHTLTEGQL